MLFKQTCYCCGYPLLRHIRTQGVYWFCLHCYQEMPIMPPCVHLSQADKVVSLKKSDTQGITAKIELIV